MHVSHKGYCTERDNGLDNKTVPSQSRPLHPFSFTKILKSRNRNFNPADPNESSDVRESTLILEFRYWLGVKLFTNLTTGKILIWKNQLRVTIRSHLNFGKINSTSSCVSKTQWNGPPVRRQIYMGGGTYTLGGLARLHEKTLQSTDQ